MKSPERLRHARGKIPDLKVSHLMSHQPITAEASEDLETVATKMARSRVRHIPVVDQKGMLKGLISHRDILKHSVSRWTSVSGEDPVLSAIAASEVMNPTPVTCGPDLLLKEAARTMFENQFGCLPVCENGRLIGILTEGDFVSFFADPI